jgi:hypothetical protein
MRSLATTIIVIAALAFARTATAQPVFPHPGGGPANAPSAEQQSALITKLTPDQVVQLLNAASVPSEVVEDDKHNKWVVAQFWGKDLYSGVITEHCENFGKSPSVNQAWLNAWNRSKVSVKAYRSSDNLIFSYDLPLFTGVTADYIITVAKFFKAVVESSTEFKP